MFVPHTFSCLCHDEKITLVCHLLFFVLSFSFDSLPHAVSLTARVKRSNSPRIANVLQGEFVKLFSLQEGEDIHNTGIKLLKVTQHLPLQLPAVNKRCFAKVTVRRKQTMGHVQKVKHSDYWLLVVSEKIR